MAGNRKQPFGYRILCGKIVPYENEAETVRWIFETYVAGATYSALVEALQDRGVPYDMWILLFTYPSRMRSRTS